jgi:tripartite-type tricarboxylate transporter receptor subunit TctC
MKTPIAALVFAAALAGLPVAAPAQSYPSRPVTLVVPFPAGGPTDVIARTLAQHMRESLGQSVVVENVTGANGNIGVGRVARAAPDGYTITIGHWSTHVVNGAVYPLAYDVLKDFEPISLVATNSYLIVAKNTVPAGDLKSFIAWLKANPDKASEGTAGAGSPQHISGVFFQNATGTRFQFVPYRGAAPAMQALVAGDIDLIIDDPTSSLPQVRAGRIKAFAVTAKSRLAAAPDIPTVDEAGLPGFYFSRWHALWAPKGTPKDVVAKLNAAVVAALADETVRSRLTDLGQEIYPRAQQTPEALAALHKAEIEKWWPLIKAAGIKAE